MKALSGFCLALAAMGVLLLMILPAGSQAALAPLAAVILLGPLSVALGRHRAQGRVSTAMERMPAPATAEPFVVPEAVTREAPNRPSRDDVALWMLNRLPARVGSAVLLLTAYADYQKFCRARDREALPAPAFLDAIEAWCAVSSLRLRYAGAATEIEGVALSA